MAVPAVLGAADGALLLPWTPGRRAADLADGGTAAADLRPASGRVAGDLAVMLAAVHSLPAPQIARDPVRGVPLVDRAAVFAKDLSRLGADPRVAGVRSRAMRLWVQGIQDPTGHVLHAYREHARWDDIRRDELWDALVARSWAWAARLALALVTAYPEQEPLGACARRFLAGGAVSRPDQP